MGIEHERRDAGRDADVLVVVGASAGGVGALVDLVAGLPSPLGAAVLVVLHVPAEESALPEILSRRSRLLVRHATDRMRIAPDHVYVAPPDRHLLVRPGEARVVRGPRENLHRPAIDPLFRSAAVSYGPRVVAVVLTGSRDDGAAGAVEVSRHGGIVLVQDPGEALFPSMPSSVIALDDPDEVLP